MNQKLLVEVDMFIKAKGVGEEYRSMGAQTWTALPRPGDEIRWYDQPCKVDRIVFHKGAPVPELYCSEIPGRTVPQ